MKKYKKDKSFIIKMIICMKFYINLKKFHLINVLNYVLKF